MTWITAIKFGLLAILLATAYHLGSLPCKADFAAYRASQADLAVQQALKHDQDIQNAQKIHDEEIAAGFPPSPE